jgi:hypothetical protein
MHDLSRLLMLTGNEMSIPLSHCQGLVAENVLKSDYITPSSRQ